MTTPKLSVSEAIRFANHDFMNKLQLINMCMDLGRIEQGKAYIEEAAAAMQVTANINRLRLPKTSEWLQTLGWRYHDFEVILQSAVTDAVTNAIDVQTAQYLEDTIIHIASTLDPFVEQKLCITVATTAKDFTVEVKFLGKWRWQDYLQNTNEYFVVTTYCANESCWHYVLQASRE